MGGSEAGGSGKGRGGLDTDGWQGAAVAARRLSDSERMAPCGLLAVLVLSWGYVLGMALLRGGHGAAPLFFAVPCGGWLYWMLIALSILGMVSVTCMVGCHLSSLQRRKAEAGLKALEGDIAWERGALMRLPAFCMIAGVAAGLLGIGGGMMTGPLMLELGINPVVSSATSAFMVLFTSSATTAQFLLAGMLRLDLGLWYGAVGALGTLVGQGIASYFIRKYARESIIVLALGGVIGVSSVAMGLAGLNHVVADYHAAKWDAFELGSLCNAGRDAE